MMKMSALADIANSTATAWRLFDMFDRKSAVDSFSEEGLKPDTCRGEVEVKDVSFAYPTAPDHMVCRGFCLHIPAGRTMALCGASGSGKSTLIQLLERFYDPAAGVITLDGVDIRMLNVRWLRGQMGLVGQEPVLFQGTVAQNIAFGKATPATQEEIEAAAKAANAHTFITENLQFGYNTEVGLQGGRLSGGQKQRVAIARALVKKPALLLLDEATSALDNQSEGVVQAALDEVMATSKLTTIVIAHRLSTIRTAHAIAVVNEGKVIENGTHDELLAQQGMYASLVLSHS
jgi:ATP-binding cassette subfamily B (MDR/TAP) protein 1